MIPHEFQRLIRIGVFDHFSGFDLVDAADRAFDDIVFILQPGKETGQNAPDVVNGHFAGTAILLIICQIPAQIIRHDLLWGPVNGRQHGHDGFSVIG